MSHHPAPPRLTSLDALRGLVIAIMALDHTRDFFHAAAMTGQPDDLTRTTAAIFLTRWVTHLCAPTFFLTAGMAARLRALRPGSSAGQVSRFLWTRGLWLIVVELVVMRFAMNFTFDVRYPVLLIILWALGWAMIGLAALVHLPDRAIAGVAAGVLLLHNLLDPIRAAQLGPLGWLWTILHEPGAIATGGPLLIAGYPVLPWVGVIAAGYAGGIVFTWEPARRQRALARAGLACMAAFLVIRAVNAYGDPRPWAAQATPLFTGLSFLNTTKYPPSLAFLLMTLGPALVLLAGFDRRPPSATHPLVAFGRTPFAFYVGHFFLLHVLAALAALGRYGGASLAFLPHPLPSMGGPAALFPPGFGYGLPAVYVVWLAVLVLMLPVCRWFARVKARRRDWWLSYL
jgi:uncharacterized membrane protein